MNPEVRFTVLGPVRAWRQDVEIDLRPPQLRSMLGLLLVRAPDPVAPEEFSALLWGEDPPARAGNIVHRHIGALRKLLEPELANRAQGRWLTRAGSGYRLEVAPSELDLLHFREQAEAATLAAEGGDHPTALAQRAAALRLWHGRCAAGIDPGAALAPEFAAVDQERVAVACAAVDDALRGGDPGDLVPLIQAAADQNPLDEVVHARLIILLSASGRQAAAGAVYHAIRLRLTEQLGVDPGRDLVAAYDRVLRQDSLVQPAPAPDPRRSVPSQLPPGSNLFTGRDAELDQLSALAAEVGRDRSATVIGVVDGLPGMGKTSLVVHWAHRMSHLFPDGRLFINLQGFDPSGSVVDTGKALEHLLTALDVPYSEMPADMATRTNLYRSRMAERRTLLVLDNARDEEHVRPLLPASSNSLVLVTSRNRLTGLVTREGATPVSLGAMTLAESRAVVRKRVGDDRQSGDEQHLDEIIASCGGLPLALAVVCARALAYECPLREVADELRHAVTLDPFDGDEPRSDVRNVFSWSYHMLSDQAAQLFRLLPLHLGTDFGVASAASLAGVPFHTARKLLGELNRTRLLTEVRLGRYAMHDLIRVYAGELGAGEDLDEHRRAAVARLLDHLRQTAYAAGSALMPSSRLSEPPRSLAGVTPQSVADAQSAMSWFTTELTTIEGSLAVRDVPEFRPWQLAEALMPYYQRRAMVPRWLSTATLALRVAVDAGDLEGQAVMHRMMAGAEVFGSHAAAATRFAAATRHLERALELFDAAGRPLDMAFAYCNFGTVHDSQGRHREALTDYERAMSVFESLDHERGLALALFGRGWQLVELGDLEAGLENLARAEALAIAANDDSNAGSCAGTMAEVLRRLGRLDEAVACLQRARELFLTSGNHVESAKLEKRLGDVFAATGRPAEALSAWRMARDRYADLGQEEAVAQIEKAMAAR
ncbi:BTAD domain-containing putative transcriptional regulator [Micromonospora sp. NPDC048898]|uniref:AfsR/SARP family transcriptional regulator n=1 Tax=Micromonospora sp. NPDC048898 TaxID=3364260 RepID=UPI0037235C9D